METKHKPAQRELALDSCELVEGIVAGDGSAVERLYSLTMPGLRAMLAVRVRPDLIEDCCHEIFLRLIRFLQKGSVRDPRCLVGILHTIAVRHVSGQFAGRNASTTPTDAIILENCVPDSRIDLEREVSRRQQRALALATLASLSERDREILTRFYIREQSPEQICREMGLTETQYRLLKSRAKARFGELGRRYLRSNKRSWRLDGKDGRAASSEPNPINGPCKIQGVICT